MIRSMAVLVGVLSLVSLSAQAHTRLVSATPADDAVVSAPGEIVLNFSEAVRLTAVSIVQNGQQDRSLELASTEPSEQFTLTAPRLAPGEYVVNWRAVGADTHVVSGEIHFTVRA